MLLDRAKKAQGHDLESYRRAVKLGGEAIPVGKLSTDPKTKKLAFVLI